MTPPATLPPTPTALAAASLAAALAATALAPAAADAQRRLLGEWTVGSGFTVERYDFGATGLAQGERGTDDAAGTRVLDATQWTLPVSVVVPLGERFTVDAATAFTNGSVTLAPAAGPGSTTARLSGLGDVRLRATGRLRGDAVVLTVGANLPTGIGSLDAEEVAALGVLAAPALGANLPAVGFGPGVTTGVVLSRVGAGWAWAGGLSYEVRGRFSPVAALSAGLATPRFDPGNTVHLSLGTDGFLGESALSVALTGDFYTQDRLVAGGAGGGGGGAIRLGPTLGAEVRLRAAVPGVRELTFHASERYRGSFERDGATVAGTSANYVDAGVRAAIPVGRRTDVTASALGWHQTGLDVDATLVTAETLSGALTLGLSRRVGTLAVEPFARLRAGTIDTGVGSANVTGLSGGIALSARF